MSNDQPMIVKPHRGEVFVVVLCKDGDGHPKTVVGPFGNRETAVWYAEQRRPSRVLPLDAPSPTIQTADKAPDLFGCDCKGPKARHNERYNAYYCKKCGAWMESRCSDPDCEFCVNRPDKSPTLSHGSRAHDKNKTGK